MCQKLDLRGVSALLRVLFIFDVIKSRDWVCGGLVYNSIIQSPPSQLRTENQTQTLSANRIIPSINHFPLKLHLHTLFCFILQIAILTNRTVSHSVSLVESQKIVNRNLKKDSKIHISIYRLFVSIRFKMFIDCHSLGV